MSLPCNSARFLDSMFHFFKREAEGALCTQYAVFLLIMRIFREKKPGIMKLTLSISGVGTSKVISSAWKKITNVSCSVFFTT